MPLEQIPRERWQSFFREFSQIHETWICRLEIRAPYVGDVIKVDHMPLAGLDMEQRGGHTQMQIFLSVKDGIPSRHDIEEPTGVWLETTPEGADAAIRIENADGLLRLVLRSPMLPEQVDGPV
jgi:hypothetical protein